MVIGFGVRFFAMRHLSAIQRVIIATCRRWRHTSIWLPINQHPEEEEKTLKGRSRRHQEATNSIN